MRKLRIQFVLFFIVLAAGLSLLIGYALRQMNREEQDLWREIAEESYNEFQAEISEFLTREDKRSFSQYRYYYVPEGQDGRSRRRSPLSKIPKTEGLIGYFQIDPDNSFHTPYLPPYGPLPRFRDFAQRQVLEKRLKDMAHSLLEEKPETLEEESDDKAMAADFENIYPNPIKEQKNRYKQKTEQKAPQAMAPPASRAPAPQAEASAGGASITLEIFGGKKQRARRKVAIAPRQLESFAQQTLNDRNGSAFVDPFQARLASADTLIFYRKVWLNQQRYIQGFAMQIPSFFKDLMGETFANSGLIRFAKAQLIYKRRPLADFAMFQATQRADHLLFQRTLGYPLDLFSWKVLVTEIPHGTGRFYLYTLSGLLGLLSTLGLFLMYRSVASQLLLSQKRQDFVAAVTHELKTPLTSIRMYSEMLEDGWAKEDTQKQQEYYRQINKESSRLSRLIENILQLARLEKGTYKVDLKTADPTEGFEEIGKELQDMASHQGFTLTFEHTETLPAITYDPEALKQILVILLDNSLKFAVNGEDKGLEMSLSKSDGTVTWSWSDHGPGIPDSQIKKVFEKFYRVENELTRTTKGTGIGLAMAQMIADAMGAKISASNRKDGGLEIKLTFVS